MEELWSPPTKSRAKDRPGLDRTGLGRENQKVQSSVMRDGHLKPRVGKVKECFLFPAVQLTLSMSKNITNITKEKRHFYSQVSLSFLLVVYLYRYRESLRVELGPLF